MQSCFELYCVKQKFHFSLIRRIMKSLIYLSYLFPPLSCGANTRNITLPKYLPRFGWEFNVLTSASPRGLPIDHSLMERIPEDTRIKRIPHFDIMSMLRGVKENARSESKNLYNRDTNAITLKDYLRYYLLIPDRVITWMINLVPAGIRYVRETDSDLIVSAGPHHSLHLHAWLISRITDIKWVPYFGDLWVYDSNTQYPPGPIKGIHSLLERAVVNNCDGIITTTPLSSNYFEKKYGTSCPECVEVINGYDPESIPDTCQPIPSDDSCLTITYTGNLLGFNTPEYLPAGIDGFASRFPEAKVKILFVGTFSPVLRKMIMSGPGSRIVEFVSRVPSREVRKYQCAADVLMTCLANRDGSEMKNTAKLGEYVTAAKPLLIISRKGDMRNFLDHMQGGYSSNPDKESVTEVLTKIFLDWQNGELKDPPDPDAAAEIFDMSGSVERLAEFLHRIIDQ